MSKLRIKEVIKEKGSSLEALSKIIGVNASAISQSINGNPTVERLTQIADALGVDITELFEQKDKVRLFAEYKGKKYEITHSDIIEVIKNKVQK